MKACGNVESLCQDNRLGGGGGEIRTEGRRPGQAGGGGKPACTAAVREHRGAAGAHDGHRDAAA